MPPKQAEGRTQTRSKSRDQGIQLEWSQQLGGSVEVSSNQQRDQESQLGASAQQGDQDQAQAGPSATTTSGGEIE